MTLKTWTLLTPQSMGAIAILQIPACALCQLTNQTQWELGTLYLADIPEIDEVIAVKINEDLAQIMPHGGMQILRKLTERFAALDIMQSNTPRYAEAQDEVEARMLATLAVAQSPLAVELLLQQPSKLRALNGVMPTEVDLKRAGILNHLIHPPKVVLLGAPNTGKSTLMNALTKQDTSIVHELPGATRDAVGARVNCAGLVVDFYDLPGFRESGDPIEQEAIQLAQYIAADASLILQIFTTQNELIPLRNFSQNRFTPQRNLKVSTMADISKEHCADLCVSAHTGENMDKLALMIRDAIVPPEILADSGPWFFPGSYSPTDE